MLNNELRFAYYGADEFLFGDLLEIREAEFGEEFLRMVSNYTDTSSKIAHLIVRQVILEACWSRALERILGGV